MTLLQCTALTKRYGRTLALDNLSLTLEAGDPIALIGPNGAGKTTLLSLLCGFIRPSSGSVSLFGDAPGSAALVGRVGALPQDATLDPRFSIHRQFRMLARLQGLDRQAARQETDRVLQRVQLADAAHKSPAELSHGMRKRMALAQALIGKPAFIVLDEPTAGIDPPNVKIIRDLVRELSREATFLISSHNLDELEKLCSRVVYLSDGRLVQSGALEDESDAGYLTVRVPDVPAETFRTAVGTLPGVVSVRHQSQGDYLIEHDPSIAIDETLLALIKQKGWHYRYFINGRSLEEKLYG